MRSVLISGASIAGPTLAYWLRHYGFHPTIVERAPAPRPGGHAIDIRGAALPVIAAMGLLDGARARRMRSKGVSGIDADGRERWCSEADDGGDDDIELLRDDLASLLHDRIAEDVELIHGDTVTAIAEDADGLLIRFEKTASRRFDLVVGADGIHSNIRRLVFGDEARFVVPLGIGLAVYSAPKMLDLDGRQIFLEAGDRNCLVYPVRDGREMRVCLGFPARPEDESQGDVAAQQAFVARACSDMGWEVPRLLAAMAAAPDFYLGAMAQIRMPHWISGRTALIGDAGWCPSPYTGQGTSLAIVGAFVLAQQLAANPGDHAAAFAAYEAILRPFVARNQAIADIALNGSFAEAESRSAIFRAIEAAKNAITLDVPG